MRRLSLLSGLALILGGVALLAYVFMTKDNSAEAPVEAVTSLPAAAVEEPIAAPTETPSGAPVVRLQVPSLSIDAPVVSLGVLAGGVMESPHTPTDVGWYTFSAQPGVVGNAVFAGHVDYVNHGPAVFYRLRELKAGDAITVLLEDGISYTYRVVSSDIYDADDAPVQEIVGPTPTQTITMITCTGVFDRNVLEYDKRLVVRAERSAIALD